MINKDIKRRIYTSLSLFFLVYLIFFLEFILIFVFLIFGVFSLIEFYSLTKKISSKYLVKAFLNLFFSIYIFVFSYLFIFFSQNFELKIILFTLLLSCVASDIGGFIFGKTFNGPKLTKISPNKTIIGSFGAIIFTVMTLSSSIYYFINALSLKIILIGILTSIACQIGDLIFSLMKRKAKVKDTGNIFPGHGGVLDRIDGILFGIPFGFIFLVLLH
tara:strand:+ start:28 stop:678 length:651 start_codon:yes stop_codon:yes gene_type:complete